MKTIVKRFTLSMLLAATIIFTLQACGSGPTTRLYGHVLKDGQNLVGYQVVLTHADGGVFTSKPVAENGIYTITDMPGGDYKLTLIDTNGDPVEGFVKTIFISVGEPQKITIEI